MPETKGADVIPFKTTTIEAPTEIHPATDLVTALDALTVTNEGDLEVSGNLVKDAKALSKVITDDFEPSRVAAKAAYDTIRGQRDSHLKPLDASIKQLRNRMNVYVQTEENKREQARKDEQEKLRKAQEESAMQHAQQLSDDGKDAAAERLVESVAEAPEPIVTPTPAPATRTSTGTMKRWQAKVVDEDMLYSALAKHPYLRDIAPVSEKVLRQKSVNKGGPSNIPGVEFFQETSARIK